MKRRRKGRKAGRRRSPLAAIDQGNQWVGAWGCGGQVERTVVVGAGVLRAVGSVVVGGVLGDGGLVPACTHGGCMHGGCLARH